MKNEKQITVKIGKCSVLKHANAHNSSFEREHFAAQVIFNKYFLKVISLEFFD